MGKLDLEARLAQMKSEAEAAPDNTVEKGASHTSKPKPAPASQKTKKRAPGKAVVREATAPNKMAEKCERFAHAYVRSGCNATRAYKEISPDCTDVTAATEGGKYLRKPQTQRILMPLLEGLMEKNAVNTEFVLSRMLEQANASPLDYFYVNERGQLGGIDVTGITDAQRRNLKTIRMTENSFVDKNGGEHTSRSWHITVVDQQKAIEMFARYLQMFTRDMAEEDLTRIGDLIEAGVKRIRANKDLEAWRTIDAEFSEVG